MKLKNLRAYFLYFTFRNRRFRNLQAVSALKEIITLIKLCFKHRWTDFIELLLSTIYFNFIYSFFVYCESNCTTYVSLWNDGESLMKPPLFILSIRNEK